MNWYKQAKFINNSSSLCIHCMGRLSAKIVTNNPRHHFNPGTIYSCRCGKSKVWANSVRNKDAFIKFIDGKSDQYYQGFCNDKYCGYCFDYLQPLKNGYKIPGIQQMYDLYGCANCEVNQGIAMDLYQEDGEGETDSLVSWYRDKIRNSK